MVQRVLECQRCGVAYIAPGNNSKYCKICSRIEKLERDRANHKRPKRLHVCDTVDVISICLNCTKETCPGSCDDIRRGNR